MRTRSFTPTQARPFPLCKTSVVTEIDNLLPGAMNKFVGGLLAMSLFVSLGTEATEKVVIIGGGAAGLLALDRLSEAGIQAILLEQNARPGGRLFSRPAIGDLELVLDEGANLINSSDEVTLSLLKRFRIPYVRRFPAEHSDHMAFLIEGRFLTQSEVDAFFFQTNAQSLWRIAQDQRNRREDFFTETSIEHYLQEIDADETLTHLFSSFFWSEFGRELKELNVNVFFDYISVDVDQKQIRFIPYYDEAFTIPGGAGQITDQLAARNKTKIQYENRVTRIERKRGKNFFVTALSPEGESVIEAKRIIFAAPLHILNNIDVDVPELSKEVLAEAANSTYARGVKLHLKFNAGFRQIYKFPGIVTTDTGEQFWTSSQGQPGDAGLLTVLTGPLPGGAEAQALRIRRILLQLEKIAPGVSDLYVGAERSEAPFSYSGAFRPFEPKTLKINQLRLSSRWITIGEASSSAFQGYLEGAFSSADENVKRVIQSEEYFVDVCSDLVI